MPGDSATSQAIEALAQFIPAEMLAPYVAALSLIATSDVGWSPTAVYWVFAVATPVMFLLFHYARIAKDPTKQWPTSPQLPILGWRALAAFLAFLVWALAVPTSPVFPGMTAGPGAAAVAGFLAIIVSPILTAVDAIVVRLLQG